MTSILDKTKSSAWGIRSWLPWAVYVGMSWTWCIGMFLPVLLLRDLGWVGFLVFAVPNVVGAAAMGWILRDADHSRRIVAGHERACISFSLVTILFHVFFVAWIVAGIVGHAAGAWAAAAVILGLLSIYLPGTPRAAALATLAVSLAALAWGLSARLLPYVAQPLPGSRTALPPLDALWLAPICLLGFALCPYLDLTFHRARQELINKGDARTAFTIGFGFFFALMLAFTVCYSGWLAQGPSVLLPLAIVWILVAHLLVQTIFTMRAHVQQLAYTRRPKTVCLTVSLATAVMAAVAAGEFGQRWHYHQLSLGEVIYRGFMVFYGLAFPAYVWICMIRSRTHAHLAAAILLALPCCWLGFIERQTFWMLPAACIVLIAGLIPSQPIAAALNSSTSPQSP